MRVWIIFGVLLLICSAGLGCVHRAKATATITFIPDAPPEITPLVLPTKAQI
jgi:hypothetical protein